MVSSVIVVLLMVFALLRALPTRAEDKDWGYVGEEGPDNWYRLDPEYRVCREGKNQAPINIVPAVDVDLPPLELSYIVGGTEIVNNGHSLQIDFPAGNTLRASGLEFALQQVHFHAPSENHLNGTAYPFEAHFVHQDAAGNLAVPAVFYVEGTGNAAFAELWKHIPAQEDEKQALPGGFAPQSILPDGRDYIYFNGSLTTPPCTEGVRWYVLKDVETISREQVETFVRVMHHPNNRPLQAVNARVIVD